MFTNTSRPSAVDVLRPFTIGDIFTADTTSTLAKVADVAVGNVLLSGGVGAIPAWGKVTLTSHVSGVLPAVNGGTGVANTGTITTAANISFTGAGSFDTGGFTLTIPATGTAALLATANAFTAAQTIQATNGLTVTAASTQDAMRLAGRAGGTSSYIGTLTPTTLSASRTWTFPDLSLVMAGSASALTSTRVPFATTGGALTDSAGMTFASGTSSLTITGNMAAGGTDHSFGSGSNGTTFLAVSAATAQSRTFRFQTAGTNRWAAGTDTSAESGANAGCAFILTAYADAGTSIDNPISCVRASAGTLTLGGSTARTVALTGAMTVASTTDSTTKDTGSIVTEGGIGAEKSIFSGGMIGAAAATTSLPSMRLPHGTAPSSPTNGDMWTTTAGLFVRINGVTVGPLS